MAPLGPPQAPPLPNQTHLLLYIDIIAAVIFKVFFFGWIKRPSDFEVKNY